MEIKQPKLGRFDGLKGLERADKQISLLKELILPLEPHILTVPTKTPFNHTKPHEYEGMPFEPHEVKHLQYFTMISAGNRGVGVAVGASEWQDQINGKSPYSMVRSSTTTPNPARESRKPANKMSIADYKNMKQTGIKPSPKPVAADSVNPSHSRNTSAVSGAPMERVPSLEGGLGGEVKQVSAGASFNSVTSARPAAKETVRSAKPVSKSFEAPKSAPTTNGHIQQPARDTLHVKDINKDPQSRSQRPEHAPPIKEQIKHSLLPRPQSPPRKNPDIKHPASEPKQQKRPLESADPTPPEKRAKIGHSRTPSNSSLKTLPRNPATPSWLGGAPSSHKPSTPGSSALPKKATLTKPIETNKASRPSSEKTSDLPPLLSPLPADLENGLTKVKMSDSGKNSLQNTPSRLKIGSDTIVVKNPHPPSSSPLSEPPRSPPFVMPPLLSPTLPEIVEKELDRLKQKKDTKEPSSLNSVEARHEKVRRPETPGVARKTTASKVGHPPKKTHAEPMKVSMVVKLKYKKRKANDVQRILGIRPRPTKEFTRLEDERLAALKKSAFKDDDESSDDDIPLSKITVAKPNAAPAKKRPSDVNESPSSEPAPKRIKAPDTISVSKSRVTLEPPFKSPGLNTPSHKDLLATPKKGDAMKSVAMRKVDSNDGLARTPQTAATSTPASAEKPRLNGDIRPSPENEKLRADQKKAYEVALSLKRKMDGILKVKSGPDRSGVTEADRKLGCSIGCESLATYMNAFYIGDTLAKHRQVQVWHGALGLVTFLDRETRTYPALSALKSQLGAVICQELSKAFMELPDPKEKYDDWRQNEKRENGLWLEVHRNRKAMQDGCGATETLGPWSTVPEVVDFTMKALDGYAKTENTGWKRME